jgi:hypothetical protein
MNPHEIILLSPVSHDYDISSMSAWPAIISIIVIGITLWVCYYSVQSSK